MLKLEHRTCIRKTQKHDLAIFQSCIIPNFTKDNDELFMENHPQKASLHLRNEIVYLSSNRMPNR